ncbi:peptidyl-prolyl cis-trans isomerase [Parafrankia sp. BMG5.11]|nr:peptidyl-prolyl cis-trans isomerase [Parafrankia sp. BMG5.11]
MTDSTSEWTNQLRRWRLPLLVLVLVLLAGAAILAARSWRAAPGDHSSRSIHLTRSDQAQLSREFADVTGRPPTQAELDTLISRRVREEVLYREALRRGLDKGDPVMRKRLAQKMDAIAASAAGTGTIDDATLNGWLQAHPDRFAQEMKLTFDQLYFTSRSRAVVARTLLEGGANWTRVGDAISLPAHFNGASRQTVSDELDQEFAHALEGLAPGDAWHGPVEGALGWHLVRLTAKQPGVIPPLAAIRSRVEDDWRAAMGRRQQDESYRALRDDYRIRIDR